MPQLKISTVVRHLDHPWDVKALPGGVLIFTQRDRATLSVFKNGKVHRVGFPRRSVWVSGETGLMGLEVDPDFANNHRIYTCQGGFTGGGHDVHVTAWTLDDKLRKATMDKVLVGGFPTSSGRHGGCRLRRDQRRVAAGRHRRRRRRAPTRRTSTRSAARRCGWTGSPARRGRPTRSRARPARAATCTPTAIATCRAWPSAPTGTLWSIEQGSFRDDEVNLLVNGGDYGWNPVPGYNESVPMTDQSLPGKQLKARWRSGNPTLATSGGGFVNGAKWGALDGALAVACLKASRVLFLTFDGNGKLQRVRAPRALRQYGRIRQVSSAENGDLLVTTDNGGGDDVILRVSPS